MPQDYETTFDDFWAAIVCPNGVWNFDQMKRELHDFFGMMDSASKVYEHVTGGRISKPNTHPDVVISVADACFDEQLQEELADRDVPFVDEAAARYGDNRPTVVFPTDENGQPLPLTAYTAIPDGVKIISLFH